MHVAQSLEITEANLGWSQRLLTIAPKGRAWHLTGVTFSGWSFSLATVGVLTQALERPVAPTSTVTAWQSPGGFAWQVTDFVPQSFYTPLDITLAKPVWWVGFWVSAVSGTPFVHVALEYSLTRVGSKQFRALLAA